MKSRNIKSTKKINTIKWCRLTFFLFLIPVFGKAYLWILKPEWTFVPRLWAIADLPLYLFATLWIYRLTFSKQQRYSAISKILLYVLLIWEVILNIFLPDETWVLPSIFSLLGLGPIIGFFCLIPGYVLLAKHGFKKSGILVE